MTVHTFTVHQFLDFKGSVKYWLAVFGLTEWRVSFAHEQIGERCSANVTFNNRSKSAHFQLTFHVEGDYGILTDPHELALHEVLHLLIADYGWTCSKAKDDYSDICVSHEHEIVNRLMKAIKEVTIAPAE